MRALPQLEELQHSLQVQQKRIAARKAAIARIERQIQCIASRYDAIVAHQRESNLAVGGSGKSLLTEDLELRKASEIDPLTNALANFARALAIEEKKLAEQEVSLAEALAAHMLANTTFDMARAIPQDVAESVRATFTEVDPAFQRLFNARQSLQVASTTLAQAQKILEPIRELEQYRSGLSCTLSARQKRRSRLVAEICRYRRNLEVLDAHLARASLPARIARLRDSRNRIGRWMGDRIVDLQSIDTAIAQVHQQLSDVDATLRSQANSKRRALANLKQAKHSLEIFQAIVAQEESRSSYFAALKSAISQIEASPPPASHSPSLLRESVVPPVGIPIQFPIEEPVAIASDPEPPPQDTQRQSPLPSPSQESRPYLSFDEMRQLANAFGGRAKLILAGERFSYPKQTLPEYHFEFRDFKLSRQFFDTIHGCGKYGKILQSEYALSGKGTRLFTRAIMPSDGYQYIVRSPVKTHC